MRCKNCKKQTQTPFCSANCMKEYFKTDAGKKHLEKVVLKVKKEREKNVRERKKEIKESNEVKLQKVINQLARFIDAKCGYTHCICCDSMLSKNQIHGAHYHSVGSNCTLRYNLHNIHSSRGWCNKESTYHRDGYLIGLEARYGLEYRNMILSLPKVYKSLKLSAKDIHDKLILVRSLIKNFEDYEFNNGIEGRELFNQLIGIY